MVWKAKGAVIFMVLSVGVNRVSRIGSQSGKRTLLELFRNTKSWSLETVKNYSKKVSRFRLRGDKCYYHVQVAIICDDKQY